MRWRSCALAVAVSLLALSGGSCDPSDTLPVPPDFAISAAPPSGTVLQGATADEVISTTSLGGFSGDISLSISGLPAGVTASSSPTSVAAGSSDTLTLTASQSAAPTASPITVTITGTSGSHTHTCTFTLSVVAANTPDFTLTALPSSRAVAQGGSSSETIGSSGLNGFSGNIALTVSELPAGVTGSFSPSSVAAGSSATLTLTASQSAPPTSSPVTVTVTGTSGSITRVATFALLVVGVPDFALAANPPSNTLTPGASATETIDSSGLNGFSGNIALTVSGLPAGVTGGFSPSSITAGSSATLTLTASQSTASTSGPVTVTVTGTSGSLAHTAAFTLSVVDFTLAATPPSNSVIPGGSATETINSSALNGFSGNIALAVSGLPGGVNASFSPSSIAAGSSATLTLTASRSASLTKNPVTVTVTGSSGSLTRSTTFTLSVVAPDFALTITPASNTVKRAGTATETINTNSLNGFSGNIALAVSGLPGHVTGSFSPSSVAAGSSATLTLTASADAPLTISPATVTVTGTSGALTHSATFTLSVAAP